MADDSDNNSESFSLNLDSSDFIEQALSAKDAISGITDVEGFGELASKIMEVGAVVGVLGTAFFAIKETIDAVFDAEDINAVNEQFTQLSQNAGVYSDTLKESLIESADGWASETDIIKSANRAMVELESGVKQLPEVMELARQASAVMGGAITQNFQQLTDAIASGQTRQLRTLGIIVDQQKAYQNYAKSIGITVGELTQAGKQQAMMNAVLEQGKTAFQGLNPDVREAQTTWMQFKSTLADIGEIATIAYDKIAGPVVRNALSWMKDWASGAKTWFQANFGQGADQAAAKTAILQGKINDLKVDIIDLEQKQLQAGTALQKAFIGNAIEHGKKRLQEYEAELGQATEAQKKFNDEQGKRGPASTGGQASSVDLEKRAQDQAKFNQEMLKLDQQVTQKKISDADTVAEAEKAYNEQRLESAKAIELQIADVKAKAASGQGMTQAQADQEIIRLNQLKTNALKADEQALEQIRQQALQTYLSESTNASQGVTRAFQLGAHMNAVAMQDFGKIGQTVFDSFSKHATSSLEALGAGTENACDAMKDMFFGMLGDEAEQYGQFMLLSSIFPPNPAGMAAGAALLVLAGFLKSQGGGSSSSSSSASSTGIQSVGFGTRTDTPPTLAQQQQRNQVNITIQGHLLAGQESQNWLVNTIRSASDGSDFNISSVS